MAIALVVKPKGLFELNRQHGCVFHKQGRTSLRFLCKGSPVPQRSRLFWSSTNLKNRFSVRASRHDVTTSTTCVSHVQGNGVAAISPSDGAAAIPIPRSAEDQSKRLEERIERAIFDCRFLTLLGVVGSLAGSLLCFVKGSLFVLRSFVEYFRAIWHGIDTEVILLLVEALDIYLMGTVMLIFGMGLYELFVSTLDIAGESLPIGVSRTTVCGSNLFGLFRLQERPKWLEIRSLDELKTKLGHVIVMILLVGMFEKSKKIAIHTSVDLVCLSVSILFSSGCLFLLSKLNQK